MKLVRFAILCVLLLFAAVALAQGVPQLINFQGRLTDDTGLPIDGTREIRFRLLDADTLSATVLWSETQSSVQVNQGIYHVLLGSVNPLPPSALSQADIFLEVRVEGEILRPRSLITSVPFAHRAAAVPDGAITAGSIGENCGMGESLVNTALGWRCSLSGKGLAWTWMSGSDAYLQNGVYGTKGIPDPANVPGARRYAVSWIDSNDNMWLFGGEGFPASGSAGYLNDLWRWDGANWTWMSGSNSVYHTGVYGTKGTPDPANVPGTREYAVSWIDSSDNMWLFGGYGYAASSTGTLSDLWRWDGTNWTWMSGSNVSNQNGIYGTKGTPDPANVPGGRLSPVSWIDLTGNLWLFGGYGYPASGSYGYLNDLWKWDGSEWTWMSGDTVTDQNGVYGTKGTPDPANVPGSRRSAVSWTDSSGNFWLFGGYGYPASGSIDPLNDLWMWNGTDWTWMRGDTVTNQNGVYGTKGTPDPANFPGSRYGHVSWIDSSGNFWLFGGYGYDVSSLSSLNDLWKWDGTNWTWMSGSDVGNQSAVYGTKGIPDAANVPDGRFYPVSWIDSHDNIWFFGGQAVGTRNDLWRFY